MMAMHPTRPLDPMEILRKLTGLPHRGATTEHEREAADILTHSLQQLGAAVERQPFATPRTYITEVWWLVGGTALGLLLLPALSWLAFLLVGVSVGAALVYFDWRFSPVSLLPPRATSQNIIGKMPHQARTDRKLILMAHYD